MKLGIKCCLCSTEVKVEIDNNLIKGWEVEDCTIERNCFCPEHAIIADFKNSQCSGCAGGWLDCSLQSVFTKRNLELTDDDFKLIESGICPKRVSGTFRVNLGSSLKIEEIDQSERASVESGKALAKAIKDYRRKAFE